MVLRSQVRWPAVVRVLIRLRSAALMDLLTRTGSGSISLWAVLPPPRVMEALPRATTGTALAMAVTSSILMVSKG